MIPIEHARWFSGLASQLTDAQLRQAFEAAGGTPSEVAGFAAAVRTKILELKAAVEKADAAPAGWPGRAGSRPIATVASAIG